MCSERAGNNIKFEYNGTTWLGEVTKWQPFFFPRGFSGGNRKKREKNLA